MAVVTSSSLQNQVTFGANLAIEQLVGLAAELVNLRGHPPLVRRDDGKYEGDILGFVKGLRLSARVIYFLRERLSRTELEVSWGHMLDSNEQSCSPECDVIIHTKGHLRKWNGSGNDSPVMEFKFIEASSVRAVVSCKSLLTAIDKDYPSDLKAFGVENVFLFAECCREAHLPRLREKAAAAGYRGLWCLYCADEGAPMYTTDESMYVNFGDVISKAVGK